MAGSVYRSRNRVLSHTSLLCAEDLQFPGLFLTPSGQDSNWNSLVIWEDGTCIWATFHDPTLEILQKLWVDATQIKGCIFI